MNVLKQRLSWKNHFVGTAFPPRIQRDCLWHRQTVGLGKSKTNVLLHIFPLHPLTFCPQDIGYPEHSGGKICIEASNVVLEPCVIETCISIRAADGSTWPDRLRGESCSPLCVTRHTNPRSAQVRSRWASTNKKTKIPWTDKGCRTNKRHERAKCGWIKTPHTGCSKNFATEIMLSSSCFPRKGRRFWVTSPPTHYI